MFQFILASAFSEDSVENAHEKQLTGDHSRRGGFQPPKKVGGWKPPRRE